ncbi:hypothetical protein FOL47_005788 [Perkinsus chesapeaki]|uniref:Uncharacterized protein n=1 Tax=Perkinsus chesapeaki TaxID=330153 RepID=A0A7J6MYE9_PERCH|nr:hypothetical protein FOL47_005788 [Perkinsus chesapeaki]
MILPSSSPTRVALTLILIFGNCEVSGANNVIGATTLGGTDRLGTHRWNEAHLLPRDLLCAILGGSDFVKYGFGLLNNICSTLRIATPNVTDILTSSSSKAGLTSATTEDSEQRMYIRYYPLDSHADLWSMFSLGANIQAIALDQSSQPKGDLMEDLRNSLRLNGLKWIILKGHLDMMDKDTIIEYGKYIKCEQDFTLLSGVEPVTLCTVIQQLDEEPLSTMSDMRRFLLADAAREWLLFWVKSFRYYDTLLFDTSRYAIDMVSDLYGRGALEAGEQNPSFVVRFSLKDESVKYTIRIPVNGFLLNVIESHGNGERELVGIRKSTLKRMIQREFDI